MLKISEAIKEITEEQPFFKFGMHNKLFNLTKLAKFLKPLIEVRTKKEVQITAILMNLSRMQNKIQNKKTEQEFFIQNLTVHYNLASATFSRTEENHKDIEKFYIKNQKLNKYFAQSQGRSEVTLLIEEDMFEELENTIKSKPIHIEKNLSSIGAQFGTAYEEIPGMLHYLMQNIAMQNINIHEISSTHTELVFYISKEDTNIAFNTLSTLMKK